MQVEREALATEKHLKGARILIVGDSKAHLDLLESIYHKAGAHTVRAESGKIALEKAKRFGVRLDMMVFDMRLPGMDGIELTANIRENMETRQIPIMLVTDEGEDTDQLMRGMEAGANEHLNKPIRKVELIARSRNILRQKKLLDDNRKSLKSLEISVVERTVEVEMTRDMALFGFAKLAERRDPETGGHIERIREYTRILAQQLLKQGAYGDTVDQKFVMMIYKTSPMHDIGKVGIPDRILLKPGPLSHEEFEIMKTHAAMGGKTLAQVEERLYGNPMMNMAKEIAWWHHEKWDGSGYPDGLKGEHIPMSARIMALADVYDALVSKRIYKKPIEHGKTVSMIAELSGSQFDPLVVKAFGEVSGIFLRIKNKFKE